MDEVAARIREIAAEHGVPLLEAPPLARALYAHAELEQEIPGALYNAVALAYNDSMRAPKVLAKGTDEVAARIRELGAEHGVPLLEAPPLARALYAHAEIEQEIPGALYNAVAQVLAYVFQLKNAVSGRFPQAPSNIPVPSELDPHNQSQTQGAAA